MVLGQVLSTSNSAALPRVTVGPAACCAASKLNAFKEEVDRLFQAGLWNAVVIHHEITVRGYQRGAVEAIGPNYVSARLGC